MNNQYRTNRILFRIKIYMREFLYIIKVQITYFSFRYIHYKKEPKQYFYESFKNNKEYTQICYNTAFKLHSEHYKYYHKNLLKFVNNTYCYFQMFSSKEYNQKFNNVEGFFPKTSPIRISNIKPYTYYEGIEFNNIIFSSFQIENICFHNCSFRNCTFKNITFKNDFMVFAQSYMQGFSSCDFFNSIFEGCNFDNTFFSMGNLDNIDFINTCISNCLFHRISFNKVVFSGITTLNNTSILRPSKHFDISFIGSVDNININASCVVSAFSYFDRTNLTIEEWQKYKIWMSAIHNKVANSFYTIEQIWTANHIREEHDSYVNFYYQRKKAETRSRTKFSKLAGYMSELIIGYGERPFRALASMAIIIIIFVYLYTGFTPVSNKPEINYCFSNQFNISKKYLADFGQSLYYSFFTMISVGQGSPSPSTPLSQIAMSLELLSGAILMTLFTGTLFRKYTK